MVKSISKNPSDPLGPTALRDYVSPGLIQIRADSFFPYMIAGEVNQNDWIYMRREIPHIWYVDSRFPIMGFMNRDEAILLHNIALQFAEKRALEIGCWMGWSSCHLALANVKLDVIDPVLADPVFQQSVTASLNAAGVTDRVKLHALPSPEGVTAAAKQSGTPWSLLVIDGDHERPGPARDVMACLEHCADDCAFVFHDLASPHVAEALRLLEARGFLVMLYQTQQIMGIAWRGNVKPPMHIPDPSVFWQLPHHLVGLPVSGVSLSGHSAELYSRVIELDKRVIEQKDKIALLENDLTEPRRSWSFRIRRKFANWIARK
jgi:predicted O-methyltransferase YrrM